MKKWGYQAHTKHSKVDISSHPSTLSFYKKGNDAKKGPIYAGIIVQFDEKV